MQLDWMRSVGKGCVLDRNQNTGKNAPSIDTSSISATAGEDWITMFGMDPTFQAYICFFGIASVSWSCSFISLVAGGIHSSCFCVLRWRWLERRTGDTTEGAYRSGQAAVVVGALREKRSVSWSSSHSFAFLSILLLFFPPFGCFCYNPVGGRGGVYFPFLPADLSGAERRQW